MSGETGPTDGGGGRGDPLPPLRDVIRELSLSARKSLGQNYILDLNMTRRIARTAAPLADRHVLEVGPGPGGLTRGLLMEGAARVTAIEKDPRFLPALADIASAYPGRLDVISDDATKIDWAALMPPDRETWIIANLPYNVGTQLLLAWLTVEAWPPRWAGLVLMFQREVADRLVAEAGSRAYGRLSVLASWRCEIRMELTLPPEVFTPPPKVASALVRLRPREHPTDAGSATKLARVTAAAFGQRRKMLRQNLKSLFSDPEVAIEAAALSPTARAEQIDVRGFCALARQL